MTDPYERAVRRATRGTRLRFGLFSLALFEIAAGLSELYVGLFSFVVAFIVGFIENRVFGSITEALGGESVRLTDQAVWMGLEGVLLSKLVGAILLSAGLATLAASLVLDRVSAIAGQFARPTPPREEPAEWRPPPPTPAHRARLDDGPTDFPGTPRSEKKPAVRPATAPPPQPRRRPPTA